MQRLLAPLHRRIGLASLAVFAAFSMALFSIVQDQHAAASLESTQRMNFGLARYLVDHQMSPLMNESGEVDQAALRGLAHDVMMTNPALEVYLLDARGNIKGHAIEGLSSLGGVVSLFPIQILLSTRKYSDFPLLGDDPRNRDKQNIFSVAAIGAQGVAVEALSTEASKPEPRGYLYVILRGEAAREIALSTSRSNVFRQTIGLLGFSLVIAFLSLLVFQGLITRPLRRLADQMQAFHTGGVEPQSEIRRLGEIATLSQEFQSLQGRVSGQIELIEQGHQTRRELVSNLSHDLFTPLTGLHAYAERSLQVLSREPFTNDCRMEIASNQQVILKQCHRMSERLKALFDFARFDSAALVPTLEEVYLDDLLQDVMHSYQLQAQLKGVRLQLKVSNRLACAELANEQVANQSDTLVKADLALMERVLQNLIDNALGHTPEGGEVRIHLGVYDHSLRVSVCDSGSGIPKEHLNQIFERSWRGPRDASNAHSHGSGLGLAIVKKILDLHGSKICVTSKPHVETKFEFDLPRTIKDPKVVTRLSV